MKNVSRRFFIGGLASAFACGPRRIFAAAPGAFTGGKPALAFGLLSDVHVALAVGGKALNPTYNTETLVKAFTWFRDNGADAVVIAGDLAHCGLVGELKALADAWFQVFPGDKAPDGRHVERVFVFGNHDWSSPGRAKAVFPDEAERNRNLLVADPKKWWSEIFHEEWTPFFEKQVNGYPFIGAHWCNGGCNGKSEHFTKGLKEFYEARKTPFDPAKPFFHVQHPHPRGTVHGTAVWGQDDGVSTKILSAHSNAIAVSGHSHTSLIDERSIWQGAFTSVGCGTLRDVSVNTTGILSGLEGGGGAGCAEGDDDSRPHELPPGTVRARVCRPRGVLPPRVRDGCRAVRRSRDAAAGGGEPPVRVCAARRQGRRAHVRGGCEAGGTQDEGQAARKGEEGRRDLGDRDSAAGRRQEGARECV